MIYFHIGMAKAASTTLQNIFSQINIEYRGIYPLNNVGIYEDKFTSEYSSEDESFWNHLLHANEYEFEKYIKSNNFLQYQKQVRSIGKVIFSSEKITSIIYTYPDIYIKIKRIVRMFPEAVFILVLRNPFEILRSYYSDFPFDPKARYGPLKKVNFDEWIRRDLSDKYTSVTFNLDFSKIIDIVIQLSSLKQIRILYFDDLKKDSNEFYNSLAKVLDINPKAFNQFHSLHQNKSISLRYHKFYIFSVRLANTFSFLKKYKTVYSIYNYIGGKLKKRRKQLPEMKDMHNINEVNKIFKISKECLQDLLQENISKI